MRSPGANLLFVLVMVAVVISVDWRFLRSHVWARLAVNIGIVLVFLAAYWMFLRQP